ncbi:Crp/Fnr family transcriptional regulator [Streptomyces sp. M2CJ-2]|uniref:Crp/Fnr family transcriptional regulator n=1 Tax=Streptomyces sp. M2CJ-2 TaxID=2803948 RepID=UPI001928AEA4|nr:Crp/Fnr family transcriptional regulator [Streptomyces sp. M2CJ-2]MBL3666824.1 Crp/Fnr family transcriptional regulator [Streptomyces sp. M2CJ-2]
MDGGRRSRAESGRPYKERDWPGASLLGRLGPADRDHLLTLGARVPYPADHVLMWEAEQTDHVLILLSGLVKVTGHADDDREALLAVRMRGDLLGELAALDGQPRSATVTTCGPVVTRTVPRAEFLACLRDRPRVAHAVNQSVVAKLRAANTHRVNFIGCDAATRLARVLHHLAMTYAERDGDSAVIRWPITQPELATLAGASEPSVQKALRRLRGKGVVTTGYRSIRVDGLEQLRSIGYSEA